MRNCTTCAAYLGAGQCRDHLEGECREGGGYEAHERTGDPQSGFRQRRERNRRFRPGWSRPYNGRDCCKPKRIFQSLQAVAEYAEEHCMPEGEFHAVRLPDGRYELEEK